MIKRYELTISTGYVPTWTYVEAIRELFQNAIDADSLGNKMEYAYEDGTLMISNHGSMLETASLLLGSTDKSTNKDLIGQHGEGYKIAFMVLLREGKQIVVSNQIKGQLWTVYMKKTKKYGGEPVVAIKVEDTGIIGTELIIKIDGITKEEWENCVERNLQLQEYPDHWAIDKFGRILLDERYASKVYVNGLYISDVKGFKCGYDMEPGKLNIDRDRRLVGSFDLAWETSLMWRYAYADEHFTDENRLELKNLLTTNAEDVRYITNRTVTIKQDMLAEDMADEFIDDYGEDAVPVTSQTEAEVVKAAGRDPVIVTEQVKLLIKSTDKIRDLEKPEEEWPVEDLLSNEAMLEEVQRLKSVAVESLINKSGVSDAISEIDDFLSDHRMQILDVLDDVLYDHLNKEDE